MMIFRQSLVVLTLLFSFANVHAQEYQVSIETLLIEMIDREVVTEFPDPAYESLQFSSYDRASVEPGKQSWFANWDRTMFIREEVNNSRKEFVMYEDEGAGAVVRFWMTFGGPGAGEGTLRFYFDGESAPTIEGNPMDILSGGHLVGAPLSASVSEKTEYRERGHNLYLPLPYSQGLKITYESKNIEENGAKHGNEDVYYNINYRSYPEDIDVETFSFEVLDAAGSLLKHVQKNLDERNKEKYLDTLDLSALSLDTEVLPGETFREKIDGPAAIRELTASIEAQNLPQALRSTLIEIRFDDSGTVWVPLGDFFGTGYQVRKSDTWYTTVTENGLMSAYWVMPFEKSAELVIHNFGEQPVSIVDSKVQYSSWEWTEKSMHFGGSWRQYSNLYTGEQKNMEGEGDPFDINFTHLTGKGVYVGDVLTLFNTAYDWWGEGDEKIYIDGENFPSHFGTGTEDYYGYAWVRPEKFINHPFISQPDGSGNITPGYTINTRFRALDVIPFNNELKVDMELWHWTSTVIDYAPTTFFYMKPGSIVHVDNQLDNVRRDVTLQRKDLISPRVENGKIDGQNLIVDEFTGGDMRFQYIYDVGFTENKHLWWHNAQVGDVLELSFKTDEEGIFNIKGNLTTAPDYGVVAIQINGESGIEFNGYSEELDLRKVNFGDFNLKSGNNRISVELKRLSPDGVNGFFGIDYLEFEKTAPCGGCGKK